METSTQHKTVNRAATVHPAAAPKVVHDTTVAAARSAHIPTSLQVSTLQSPYIRRFADSGVFARQGKKAEETAQRKAEGQPDSQPTATSNIEANIQSSMAVGSPVQPSVDQVTKPVSKPSAKRPTRAGAPVTGRTSAPSRGVAAVPAGPAIGLKDSKAANDPRFQKVLLKLDQRSAKAKQHPPAAQKAAEAQAAAQPPANEKLAGAQANQMDTMKAAETPKPSSDNFLTLLRAEIQKVMPKKVEDTEDFMKGDDKQQLQGAMMGNISQQKDEAAASLKSAASQTPDTSQVPGKKVIPLPPEPAAGPPMAIGAAEAMPAPRSEADVSLQQGKRDADSMLTEAKVTPQQLQKANDPRFSAALSAKTALDKHADSAPQKYRTDEQKTTAQIAARAVADEKMGLTAFQSGQIKAGTAVKVRQLTAKEKDEAERKKVTEHIQGIFEKTKAAVDKKLASLETDVSAMFDRGADSAVAKMKDYVEKRFDERYSGISGKALWLKDKLLPLPSAVKAWFDQAHRVFIQEMDALVVRVASLVETRLKEAKDEINKGQKETRDYVEGLPANLKAVGEAAEQDMKARFDELRQGVDDKKNDLAQKLAQRYKEASDKGDAALKEMKDAHKSLYERVRDTLAEVVKVLREFKARIMGMLKKGQSAIESIVADPIGFLKNLLNAIKTGISQFVNNIWTHLKAGFMGWLFGSLAQAGIPVPKDFSLPSILLLVMQVLGLTYDRIRARVARVIGERNVAMIEKAWQIMSALITSGPAKLWEMAKEHLGNLKEMIINAIQEWVVTSVIKSAVTKLISMFNPVGAIIQAIMMIYNTVMFFIERINQILDFVQAIIDSVVHIVQGAIGSAANWIEKALARTIPLIIAFLARLLGLSGITEKIQGFIKKVQHTVEQAVDKVIGKIVGGIGKLFGKDEGKKDKPKDKWSESVAAINTELEIMEKQGVIAKDLDTAIPRWRKQYGFKMLKVEVKGEEYVIEGSINPSGRVGKVHRSGSEKNPFKLEWPKPPSSAYPILYLGGKTDKTKTQKALKGLFTKKQKDDTGTEIKEYQPNQPKNLPGGEKIGITKSYRIGVGTTVGPLSDATTPGGGKILKILNKYGFDATNEYMDGDHVREIQFGGDDVVENLWPLDASINRGAGSALSKASVEYPNSGKTILISELKKNRSTKYYFKITKFRY